MRYRGHIRFDFGKRRKTKKPTDTNQYQKLISALMDVGWAYVETSAVAIETEDLSTILAALDICARQIPRVGEISAFLVDVQGSDDFFGQRYVARANHPNALDDIRQLPPAL